MINFRRILTATTLLTAAAGFVGASPLCINSSGTGFADYCSNISSASGGSYTLTLPDFDTNGGLYNLTGVTLYFSGTENVTSLIINSTEATNTATFEAAIQTNMVQTFTNSANPANKYTGELLQVFDTGGTGLIDSADGGCANNGPFATIPTAGTSGCTPGGIILGPGASYSQTPYSISNTDAAYGFTTGTGGAGLFGVTLNGTSIGLYTGTGSFNLSANVASGQSEAENGAPTFNGGFNAGATTSFQAEVDYTYTVNTGTPEPTTMLLMGGALVGLGLFGKKRFRRN